MPEQLFDVYPQEPTVTAAESAVPLEQFDHNARGYGRLPVQFRDKGNVRAIVRSRSEQAQEIEVALQALRTIASIDDSVGAQLDAIGKLLMQPRGTRDDATYRVWLRVRIRINQSNGRPRDVLDVMRLAAGAAAEVHYITQPPASFMVTIWGLTVDASEMRALLDETTAAGVRSLLVYTARPVAELFRFDTGPGFDQGHFAGVIE